MNSLLESFLATPEVAEALSDKAVIEAMLRFEAALTRAQASAGLIPPSAAQSIIGTCKVELFDCPKLVRESARCRCIATPFVASLRETVALFNPDAARFVHFACSNQDLLDTALSLVTRDVLKHIETDLAATLESLWILAERHATVAMLDRSLLSGAAITSFGLLCSQWAGPVTRSQQRLAAVTARSTTLKLGSDLVATADMQGREALVMALMATELQLQEPIFAGSTVHDDTVALACELGLLVGNLGHIAAGISHLTQFEIGELTQTNLQSELAPGAKVPPPIPMSVLCMTALSQVQMVPQQVAVLLATLSQEHASVPGHWQIQLAQWPALLTASQSISSAVAQLLTGLQADTQRMHSNLEAVRASLTAKEIKARYSNNLLKQASHLTFTQIKALRDPPVA
jgi:3-carboxy-cis,cis-muconate cycloisomerase